MKISSVEQAALNELEKVRHRCNILEAKNKRLWVAIKQAEQTMCNEAENLRAALGGDDE